MKRRDFLKITGTFTSGLLILPEFLHAFATQAENFQGANKIVFLQLNGGNDGLNTFIPYSDPAYLDFRRNIAIKKENVLVAGQGMGWHPALKNLARIQQNGHLSVLQNVGYSNPNKSHFRSREIWQTATDGSTYDSYGWLGKYLDIQCKNQQPTASVNFDFTDNPALRGKVVNTTTLRNPEAIRNSASGPAVTLSGNPQLDFVRQLSFASSAGAGLLQKAVALAPALSVTYPSNLLGQNLQWISRLLHSKMDTQLYYTSVNGFDTHDNQKIQHNQILQTLDLAVAAFYDDLRASGLLDQVTLVIYSEFGRSVKDNGSGTDHGTAAPVLVIGGKNKGKILGNNPKLDQLVNGDLVHEIDFRSIYASLLTDRLNFNPQRIGILQKRIPDLFI